MPDNPTTQMVEQVDRDAAADVSAVDAFDMGFAWAMSLRGQSLEDSRAVGRTLYSDDFAAISTRIDAEIKREGFNSLQSADLGICEAKKIIHAALQSSRPTVSDAAKVPERKIKKLMMALARVHDETVSEREQGAARALRCANGMATEYWRGIAEAAIRNLKGSPR